jgi:hypothetical protein
VATGVIPQFPAPVAPPIDKVTQPVALAPLSASGSANEAIDLEGVSDAGLQRSRQAAEQSVLRIPVVGHSKREALIRCEL